MAESIVNIKSDAGVVAKEFGEIALAAIPKAIKVTNDATLSIETRIKTRLSVAGGGTPSTPPAAPAYQGSGEKTTGETYKDSWHARPAVVTPLGVEGVVGTDHPGARRLEWGYNGTDSLGRRISQAPRPHVGPAVDEVVPGWELGLLTISGI